MNARGRTIQFMDANDPGENVRVSGCLPFPFIRG